MGNIQVLLNIPDDLHKSFKDYAYENDTSISKLIRELMQDFDKKVIKKRIN